MPKESNTPCSEWIRLSRYMPQDIAGELLALPATVSEAANEIRLKVRRPVVVMTSEGYHIVNPRRTLTAEDLRECFEKLCDYSVYSHQKELADGYLSLPGGHRAGICGTAATDNSGRRVIQSVSSMNIRIAREYIGCSRDLVASAFGDGIGGLLIAGAPCSGKTTLLRDLALTLSSPSYQKKVTIVDERGELAAMYRGEPQHTLGLFCDVLSGYPKGEGIMNAIRTLSPDVIVCDEIGGVRDAEALREGVNAGAAIIATIHARDAEELYRRTPFQKLLETEAFDKIAFLQTGARGVLREIVEVKRREP